MNYQDPRGRITNTPQKLAFGRNLTKLIAEAHCNQKELARRIGISYQTFVKMKTGYASPLPENLTKICEYFKKTPEELFKE